MSLLDYIQGDDSPMIQVEGIGQMKLSQAKRRVQAMLQDLTNRVDNLVGHPDGDPLKWRGVKTLLDRRTLDAYVTAIVRAESTNESTEEPKPEPDDEQQPAFLRRQAGPVIHPKTVKNMLKKYKRKGELPALLRKQAE